jgi:hypothetical protein
MHNLMVMDFSGSVSQPVIDRLKIIGERFNKDVQQPFLKICAFDTELRTLPALFHHDIFNALILFGGGGTDVHKSMTQLHDFDTQKYHEYQTVYIVSDFYCDLSQFLSAGWMKHKSIRFILIGVNEKDEEDAQAHLDKQIMSKITHSNCATQTLTGLERTLGIK